MLQGLSKFFVWLFCASTCRVGKAIFWTEWLLCFIVWLEGLGVVIHISIHVDGTAYIYHVYKEIQEAGSTQKSYSFAGRISGVFLNVAP